MAASSPRSVPEAPTIPDLRTDVLDKLFAPFDRSDRPGLVVGITERGRVLYRRGFGMASIQHGVANTPATRMRIASTSKHFTALAALLLAEDGLLDLDAPADRYLPGLSAARGRPTLRQFITHTSGLRCTLEMGTLANGYAAQPPAWQKNTLLRQRDTHFAPGQGQLYCNGTFHVLSLVIEQVTGMAFEEFLHKRIFEPLGMHDTESVANDLLMVPGMASPHLPAGDGAWQLPPSDSELRGDGGMISTVDDMLRWLAHLRGSKIIGRDETWRQLLEPTFLTNGLRSVYTMGLKRHTYRGVEVIHHSGGLMGWSCQMLTVPEHQLDVVVMVNGAPASATMLVREALQAVLGSERLGPVPSPARSADFSSLVGKHYRGMDGLLLGFDDVDGALGISFMNMTPAPVLMTVGEDVVASFEDIGMGPFRWAAKDLAAAARRLPLELSGSPVHLLHLDQPPAPAAAVAPHIGAYQSEELNADARIEGGTTPLLRIRGDYSAWRTFHMTPLSPDTFGLVGVESPSERYALQVAKADQVGAAGGFWIDTYRARRNWFARRPDTA